MIMVCELGQSISCLLEDRAHRSPQLLSSLPLFEHSITVPHQAPTCSMPKAVAQPMTASRRAHPYSMQLRDEWLARVRVLLFMILASAEFRRCASCASSQPLSRLVPCYPHWLVKLFDVLGCEYAKSCLGSATDTMLSRSSSVGREHCPRYGHTSRLQALKCR